ncbi:preprotein translocase subunit SecA [Sporomusa acidovorans]|uniref:Protein translocase subunit SecA n=1 Tax=Sporomusa acidovorans (strain ATCC 49682 / DSM 3132 / Mol) TaxID=1123286 RepID=A0ABZ3J7K6_SPOA4|nr:preprotein translocase subunit SecA [Sporomusa acidovorans]OZC23467.1 protein translocase subunit SecA [Sporomusa acidovorans DSM 3132]SDF27767.1 preprotein translocase subunit SecA [Sporomusa acidovorans]
MLKFLRNLFGDDNEKEIKRMLQLVEQINAFEPELQSMSDTTLTAKTAEFRRRLDKGETLDDLLPEAFAVVREGSRRVLAMRHFDVQMLGGITLHEGKISEMRTGEGKTLVATLPVYLNALTGKGVHVVTVNDYLARRDSEWMGKLYRYLGLSVGLIVHGLDYDERKLAYSADVTYGTNNEFGFDYLRDNMVISAEQMVQRPLNYAIVDEVDSILVDEARTPLIISGPGEKSTDLYFVLAKVVPKLKEGEDYTIDEKANTVAPTEAGVAKAEKLLNVTNLYESENIELSHHFNQALRAHALMKRDKDYVVKDGEVVIVDEFTGRLMFGRRYSDGLHQAIEAKEGVKVERESQTLATITFQNYFRMYKKLAGMTGTAKTEEPEFRKIYNLDVIVIPPNRPMQREDLPDVIYKTKRAKYKAVVQEIAERHAKGQPMLVGTTSIVQSEELSSLLKKKGVPHNVLNAKFHEMEAQIVAQAGQAGAVTIATNMAGRGTDIVLGTGVPELGGLHIIGTERHESRRIDNQLRGRSGRQGDPGSSRFYLSLEDDLMRLFGSDNIAGIMDKLGMEEDEPIEHALITRSIEQAQKKVEARNFDIRKYVLEYDNVMNQQREVIYSQRRKILMGDNLKENIENMIEKVIDFGMDVYANEKIYPEEWDYAGLIEYCEGFFAPNGELKQENLDQLSRYELKEELLRVAKLAYDGREALFGPENMRELEKVVMLKTVDAKWMEHLDAMEMLRQGIGLRAYGQKDPLIEYKIEGYDMFQQMIENVQEDIVRYMFRVNIISQAQPEDHLRGAHATRGGAEGDEQAQPVEPIVNKDTVGRNELCPCGSGKKYKRCCGAK